MNNLGLKPEASLLRHSGLVSLIFDVVLDDLFISSADTLGKVAGCPEAISPQPFLEFGHYGPDRSAAATFEDLDRIGNGGGWWELH